MVDLESEKVGGVSLPLATVITGSGHLSLGSRLLVFQELFSKQKGYLDEELDYRKQALDQAHKVREMRPGICSLTQWVLGTCTDLAPQSPARKCQDSLGLTLCLSSPLHLRAPNLSSEDVLLPHQQTKA
jgi:hypothetical protein